MSDNPDELKLLSAVVSDDVSQAEVDQCTAIVVPIVTDLLKLDPEMQVHVMGSLLSSWAMNASDDPIEALIGLATDVLSTLPEAIRQAMEQKS